jgi:hypothetical protein
VKSIYHEVPGETTQPIAELDISPGLTFNDIGAPDVCSYSPAGDGITDSIETRFAHPDVDRNQPAFSIEAKRVWPDVVYAPVPRCAIRSTMCARSYFVSTGDRSTTGANASLLRQIWRSASVSVKTSSAMTTWSGICGRPRGHLPDVENQDATCDCGGRYVKVVIEISRSPSTIPKNKFYVLSVALFVDDPELRARQDVWNAQRQARK